MNRSEFLKSSKYKESTEWIFVCILEQFLEWKQCEQYNPGRMQGAIVSGLRAATEIHESASVVTWVHSSNRLFSRNWIKRYILCACLGL